jgi:hypothetical protein
MTFLVRNTVWRVAVLKLNLLTMILLPKMHQISTRLFTSNDRNVSVPRRLTHALDVQLGLNPPTIVSCNLTIYLNNTPPVFTAFHAVTFRIVNNFACAYMHDNNLT